MMAASLQKDPTLASARPSISPLSTASSSPTSSRQGSSHSPHATSPVSPRFFPRVQLVPHARTASFDISLSEIERELLENTNFDDLDLSSQDFDFEDIFTYDKPQKKLARVVEVSTPTRERDGANFSFSHYSAATAARNKANRSKIGIGEKYLRNQADARKS